MKIGFRIGLLIATIWQALNLLQVARCTSACGQLLVPSFGQLLLESVDITQTQNRVNISMGDSVDVHCAEGYELATGNSNNMPLGGSRSTIMCMNSGLWSVDITDLACVKQSVPPPPVLSNFIIMIIVAAVLAVVSLLLLTTTIACAVRANRLRKELLEATYVENEIAFARTQGAFTLPNPLAVIKDEDSKSKPLYLTPDEMSEFEEKQKI